MAGDAGRVSRTQSSRTQNSRPLQLETLEPRSLLAADSGDPFAALLSHGGACNCPICSGQGLTAIEPEAATTATTAAAVTWSGTTPTPSVPALHSRQGAKATLYLDFDGNVEANWGSKSHVVTPPYDTDGNYTSFSTSELAGIREIWARVAEDYAPFNIDVTTVAPASLADRVAAKIAIGGSYSDWFGSSAGGVAYIGGFSNAASNVGFVFEDALGNGNPRLTAEAAAHEAGHLFGLAHQASWSGGQLSTEYNAGTDDWAPIMGVGYYADRTTWHRGPTTAGATSVQDDLAILAGAANGFGYAADDFGSTLAAASTLPTSGSNLSFAGLIGAGDRDVFRFTTSGGAVNLTLKASAVGANLDGVLELVSSTGQTLALANPATSLGATLAKTLAAGTYYVIVRASGGYGNAGRYHLSGTVAGNTTTSTTTTSPLPTTSPTPTTSATTTTTTATTRIIDNGSAGFSTSGSWQRATGVGSSGDIAWTPAASSGASAAWSFTGLAPGQYRVAASWPGSKLYSSGAPFSIYAGSQLVGRVEVNQERAASTFTASSTQWQNLGTFTVTGNSLTVRVGSDPEGRVIADAVRLERVYATSGGTLVRSGALAAESQAADPALSPPRADNDELRGAIDDVLFAPTQAPYWEAALRRHCEFAQPADDPASAAEGEPDDAGEALMQVLSSEYPVFSIQ